MALDFSADDGTHAFNGTSVAHKNGNGVPMTNKDITRRIIHDEEFEDLRELLRADVLKNGYSP